MPVKLRFLGGVRTVTGSSHLVTTDKSEVLIDAGLFQGRRDESHKINTTFTFNPRTINAMVLSHAHVDHCGNIPSLIKKGLRCKVYTTSATRDLARLMLEDAGKIQEEDVRYVNKINRRLGLPLREPLYTKKEASRATKIFRSLSYNQRFCITRDMFVTLFDAGHILGSAIIVLEIKDGERTIRLGYAVDLGRKNLPLLSDPLIPDGLDYLILESTYGGRLHAPIIEAKDKLKEAINRTVARRGKIIIPAFTLERTQEVVFFLNELLKERAIPMMPVYVDSPLATDITEVYSLHPDYLNDKTRLAIEQADNPFEFINLRYIRNQDESKRLNEDKRPMIIIAGSGMCESGRVLHHLKNNITDSRNTILVVGYMAKDTLGRKIVEQSAFVRIFGVEYELNAEVVVINSFSGHADQNELLEFVSRCLPLKRIFLVHGEEEQTKILQGLLVRMNLDAYIPSKEEEVLL
ncbi:MAG TPA: MBL fold metallo-hydrolase [Candidatus Omnitrophota bacterium]|nr:MBL fold metallo-hydrolase [Candidatus Omnitrophota bacterium]HPT07270.1 MBL fold metallo-hydrolase [Candidatus Omnitrophota bacterium]